MYYFYSILFSFSFFFLISPSFAFLYRPYDTYRTSAHSLAEGSTGTANPDSIADIPLNPAYLASISKGGVALGLDAQIRLDSFRTSVSLQSQYIPLANIAFSLNDNSGIGFSISAPFQRIFPDSFVINYFFELGYAYTLFRYLDVGATFGAVMGVDSKRYLGGGVSGSLSLLSRGEFGSIGVFIRPGSGVSYSSFINQATFKELLPSIFRAAYSYTFPLLVFSFELEYIAWNLSSYKVNGVEVRPTLQPHFLNFIHPHIGFSFLLSRWLPGLTLRTGLHTEDFFDFNGSNSRQILWSLGFTVLAYEDIWENRLRVDVGYSSSSFVSLFWPENTKIDKLQLTINYQFDARPLFDIYKKN